VNDREISHTTQTEALNHSSEFRRRLLNSLDDARAACFTGDIERDGRPIDLLVVEDDGGLSRDRETLGGRELLRTRVSAELFERDIENGFLGEYVASFLMLPYSPLIGDGYLHHHETNLKERVIREELENLHLGFPNLIVELLIDPRFFFHARMQRRMKIHPPSRRDYLDMVSRSGREQWHGFESAIERLHCRGLLEGNELVTITEKMAREMPEDRSNPVVPFREVERTVRRLAAYGIAGNMLDGLTLDEATQGLQKQVYEQLPDPKSYIFLRTEGGLVSIDDKRGIRELIAGKGSSTPESHSVKRIGGALNFVYLVEVDAGDKKERMVAKTYQNWYGLKWIPVNIWTVGAQNFDVLGERRMANEYKMNRHFASSGFRVPKILHVSVPRLTIVEEYIEGTPFSEIVRDYLSDGEESQARHIESLGRQISRIHARGITLGDSKPDNMILDSQEEIWFVDLEQAAVKGSQTWDLAEFLYYSGHYTLRWRRVKPMAESFIRGYLESGEVSVVRGISAAKYKRVFGLLTPPHIIMGISKLCSDYPEVPSPSG